MRQYQKHWEIGEHVKLEADLRLWDVRDKLIIGDRTVIGRNVVLKGRHIEIGRECWLAQNSSIGGGNCFHPKSKLVAGDWLHLGQYGHINIARSVEIGDEVGLGRGTCIYTHGAYLSTLEGFPAQFEDVEIGNRVWLPNAQVNPGVTIGDNVVVMAMSLVHHDLPSGCSAGGVPAHVIRENNYPREISLADTERLHQSLQIACGFSIILEAVDVLRIVGGETYFNLDNREINGSVTEKSERLKDELRRRGIRFKYKIQGRKYVPWD